ncbi:augmin subunit 6 [Tanacetum coccineum]
MTMEQETELESAMYTNCLLLGLDPSIIGSNRVGLFRLSNPKLGEQLLYFILSSLRGPKAFDKVVQKIISELESQGALPKSHSRLSSLAKCYGPRFVELLWQLSLHALREVHRRTYAADVVLNPLPASLTDVAFSHAATLLPVTKARIALERRRFLKNAEIGVQRQAMWSNLAHEMTGRLSSLGGLRVQAYLQQELEKLHDLRNKVKMEGEPWDELVSSSSQNSHLVSRVNMKYRISGSSLLAAMDESTQVSSSNLDKDQADRSQAIVNRENVNESLSTCHSQTNNEKSSWIDDRSGRGQPTVDIAEVLRRWTHALQRIHKQSLHLAKANDGEGPDLLRSANDGGTSGHAESLAATLAEHRQHLANLAFSCQHLCQLLRAGDIIILFTLVPAQVLVNQLKGVAPAIQNSISELSSSDVVTDVTSRLSSVHIDKVSSSPAALKLPPLFSLRPNWLQKSGNFYKKQAQVNNNQMDNVSENLLHEQTVPNSHAVTSQTDNENDYIRNLKKSVREAVLSTRSSNTAQSQDSHSEHFFVPLSGTGFSRVGPEKKAASLTSKQLFVPESQACLVENRVSGRFGFKYNESLDTCSNFDMLNDYDGVNGFISAAAASNYAESEGRLSFYDVEESHEQVFSPAFLMDASLSADSFEDLLVEGFHIVQTMLGILHVLVVQKIISELESQGALPRSNSRLSSLATCYGLRFVELLWQLSLHALREVHRRTYAADVVSNPLPASLTDVAFSHAATLLPVTKLSGFFISAIADLLSTCIVIFFFLVICVSLPNSLFSHNACVAAAVAAMNSDSHDDSATVAYFCVLQLIGDSP